MTGKAQGSGTVCLRRPGFKAVGAGAGTSLRGEVWPVGVASWASRLLDRLGTSDSAAHMALMWGADTFGNHATRKITLTAAGSGKSGKGHGILLKCDPSPMPPLQWLWLAGDGFAA